MLIEQWKRELMLHLLWVYIHAGELLQTINTMG